MRNVLRLMIWIAATFMACLLIFFLSGYADRHTQYTEYTYEVQPGDTLDGLYYKYSGGGNLEKWRHMVEEINGMDGACLYEGDTITILAAESRNESNKE